MQEGRVHSSCGILSLFNLFGSFELNAMCLRLAACGDALSSTTQFCQQPRFWLIGERYSRNQPRVPKARLLKCRSSISTWRTLVHTHAMWRCFRYANVMWKSWHSTLLARKCTQKSRKIDFTCMQRFVDGKVYILIKFNLGTSSNVSFSRLFEVVWA